MLKPDVPSYARRLFTPPPRQATDAAGFAAWQRDARARLETLLAQDRIAASVGGASAQVTLADDAEAFAGYTRRYGRIETEPGVVLGFWLLRPEGAGPFPLAITPHGHENRDSYVGIAVTAKETRQVAEEDQDVGRQAVRHGYLTITPHTRGIGLGDDAYALLPDGAWRGQQSCVAHNLNVIAAGRNLMGERVWDLRRILDWALTLPEVRADRVLMVGNSGGGMATLHCAAVETRIDVAVPCCSFNSYVNAQGALRHCPCNLVPGIFSIGDMCDVAGLIAPRHLLTVNGRSDRLHAVADVEAAAAILAAHFAAAGVPQRYAHRWGEGGHRFFAGIMWPWIAAAMAERDGARD